MIADCLMHAQSVISQAVKAVGRKYDILNATRDAVCDNCATACFTVDDEDRCDVFQERLKEAYTECLCGCGEKAVAGFQGCASRECCERALGGPGR
jgi:hypothetical protein